MTDGHIHIERGAYTLEWINRFVDRAVETGLDEIRLLEHNFRFAEFAPMYADRNSGAERRCPDTAPLGMDGELIRALKKHGVPIITSSDAHCPEDVGFRIRELERLTENAEIRS